MLDLTGLQALVMALRARGYDVIGPRATPTAVVFGPLASVSDLPYGWTSRQEPGRYRLERDGSGLAFAFGPASESLKRYVNPPVSTFWRATREEGTLRFEPSSPSPSPLAVIGVRPCDLQAIARYDDVFLNGPYTDPAYRARRASMFLVAANCTHPAGTCFCASMSAGPRATVLFDLALTELPVEGGRPHRFIVTPGSNAGAAVLAEIATEPPLPADITAEEELLRAAAARMGRALETAGLAAVLTASPEHPEWDDVARRCLTCANCTLVCPTCFCSTVEDRTDLSGVHMERRRRWDSCFTAEFSYIHGGSIRPSVRARYRQWLTHKFATWSEQFGVPGCVGCGRCITWCPAAIDVTEEIGRIREGTRQPATVA